VDIDSLLGRPGAVGGDPGGVGPLDPEGCRRLACDGTVTRVLVTRDPNHHHHSNHRAAPDYDPTAVDPPATQDPSLTMEPSGMGEGLQERLRAAMALLPPVLGGAASQPLEVGRATRIIQPAPTHRPGHPRRRLCLPRL
jgi:hypothetical protein